jgi:hypothetical protein
MEAVSDVETEAGIASQIAAERVCAAGDMVRVRVSAMRNEQA